MTTQLTSNLDPAPDPRDSPNDPQDHQHGTVATPEGDNEFAPDQPLEPIDEGHQKPPTIDTNDI
jgi:hypothetical protein